jgi:hypothetical protein
MWLARVVQCIIRWAGDDGNGIRFQTGDRFIYTQSSSPNEQCDPIADRVTVEARIRIRVKKGGESAQEQEVKNEAVQERQESKTGSAGS